MQSVEHRRHPRFYVLGTTARGGGIEAAVLNLSRSGMLLESARELPTGGPLRFEISDHEDRLELEALVCWSRPLGSQLASHPLHRAGIRFSRILSRQARGVWARLVTDSGETGLVVDHQPITTPREAPRVPMLTILAPEDGSLVGDLVVTVVGQLRDRGLGAEVEVNGFPATVSGHRFEARVRLVPGANLLTAAVATSGALICRSATVMVTAAPASP